MATPKPTEFPDWATDGAPSAIDTPFASVARIQTGWLAGDHPSRKTQNGYQYWTARHVEYLEQDRVREFAPGTGLVAVSGVPTVNANTLSVTLVVGDSFQIQVPLEAVESVVQLRFRHFDLNIGPTGILTVQPGFTRDDVTTPIGAAVNFANSNNLWAWDTYTFVPSPYVHAAGTDMLEFVVSNTGTANVIVQKIETTYRLV